MMENLEASNLASLLALVLFISTVALWAVVLGG